MFQLLAILASIASGKKLCCKRFFFLKGLSYQNEN